MDVVHRVCWPAQRLLMCLGSCTSAPQFICQPIADRQSVSAAHVATPSLRYLRNSLLFAFKDPLHTFAGLASAAAASSNARAQP